MTSQLPPGCDSILSIDTNDLGSETRITITFCSGAVQQFSIPNGQDGASGSSGQDGTDGAAGNGILDISSVQDGNEVTLTITLEDKTETTVTFNIPTSAGAYIIEHFSQGATDPGNSTEDPSDRTATIVVSDQSSVFSVLKSRIPGNTIPNKGDTIHYDGVFSLLASRRSGDSKLSTIFKQFFLTIGTFESTAEAVSSAAGKINLTGNPASIAMAPGSSISVHINMELSRVDNKHDLGNTGIMAKGTMSIFDKGATRQLSHNTTDIDAPSQLISTVGFYQHISFPPSDTHYINLIANPGTFGDMTVIASPIYMTTTKIPKI